MTAAPAVRLGDLLVPVSRPVLLVPTDEYSVLGVRLNGRGAFLRERIAGSETAARTLSRVVAGDFIYSRLFAWRGAFAMITEDLDGCLVSNEFPTFQVPRDRLDPSYLLWWLRSPSTLIAVGALSTGSTAITRNRLRPERLLGLSIPLPSVVIQRAIAESLNTLSSGADRFERLARATAATAETLVASTVARLTAAAPLVPLAEVCTDIRGGTWGDDEDQTNAVVLRAGNISTRGVLDLSDTVERHIPSKLLERQRLSPGDIIMTKSNSSDVVGNSAIVGNAANRGEVPLVAGNFLSRIRADPNAALPLFVWHCLRMPSSRRYFSEKAAGTSPSLQNLSQPDLERLPIPVPSITRQREILAEMGALSEVVEKGLSVAGGALADLPTVVTRSLERVF